MYSVDAYPLVIDLLVLNPHLHGVAHGMELLFVFNWDLLDISKPLTLERDRILRDPMGKMWTNFIVTRFANVPRALCTNPTPSSGGISTGFTWEEVGESNEYLFIKETPKMAQVDSQSVQFQGFYPRVQF